MVPAQCAGAQTGAAEGMDASVIIVGKAFAEGAAPKRFEAEWVCVAARAGRWVLGPAHARVVWAPE